MHGAQVSKKNIRRTGVPATIKGKPNPGYASAIGPTLERIAKAENHFAIGDDKRGGRVYQFHDSPLDRLYSRLTRQARSLSGESSLRREYIALTKYRHHWHAAGLQDSIGSVDLDRIFASDPGSMSGMAKTERQAHHRKQHREARGEIGHKPGIVVDNVVCHENLLEVAGFAIGYTSIGRAREGAVETLRQAARSLARHWGIG